MIQETIGFIGAGQMARALARGLVQAGLVKPAQLIAADPVPAALDQFVAQTPGTRRALNNRTLAEQSEIIALAVKPQQFDAATADLASATADKLVISILAGVRLARLAAAFPSA